jgi:SNF2 family DNA or RNA helicase
VFSQFTSLLALLRAELDEQGLSYCYLDGGTPQKQRQAEVDRYNHSAEIPVFLISLKAGGTGLNLTGADTVVHFDPWWNPAVEAQATDRAHRIGQKRVVTSYKLICTGTVEEKVLHMQATKRALLADVFEASDLSNAKLTLTDLKSLLQD